MYVEFLDHKVNKEKLSPKIQQDYQRRHAVWLEVAEDKPIDLYKAKDIGRFIDTCFELPKMHIAPYNKMTWAERLACDVPEEHLQAPKSVQQYYKWLQGIFAYAKRDIIGYIENSPCTIKRDFTANVRGIFNDDELRQFIKAANKESEQWKKWIIYLAIHTGARRTELVQLRKDDLKLDKDTGRYYLLITDEHESQKLSKILLKITAPKDLPKEHLQQSKIYTQLGDKEGRVKSLLLAEQYAEQSKSPYQIMSVDIEQASYDIEQLAYDSALEQLKPALVIAKELSIEQDLMTIHKLLSTAYQGLNQYQKAHLHLSESVELTEQLNSEDR